MPTQSMGVLLRDFLSSSFPFLDNIGNLKVLIHREDQPRFFVNRDLCEESHSYQLEGAQYRWCSRLPG